MALTFGSGNGAPLPERSPLRQFTGPAAAPTSRKNICAPLKHVGAYSGARFAVGARANPFWRLSMNDPVLDKPAATGASLHPLEQLAATNPDAEIWWDSSPLIFPSWKQETLAKAPEGERAEWDAQFTRFYDDATIQREGTMGFRGVTTNPPLSLQA